MQQITRKTELRADFMLMLVTLGWGVSYYAMDVALTEVDTFTLNAYRFLGAFAVAGIFTFNKLKSVNRTTMMYSVLIGLDLVIVYIGATLGVQYTTLSNSAFLCSITVIVTPILELFILKHKPSRKIVIAVTLCMIGIMFLTLKDDFSINTSHLKGDLFSLMAGLVYALEIIITDKAVKNEKVDPYQVGVFGLLVTGSVMLVLGFMFENPSLPSTGRVWGYIIFLALFCTGLAFIVQPIAQQYTEASHVGLIYALEPVFAGVTAFIMAGEILSPKGYIGEVLMIGSLFIMEIDFSRFTGKKEEYEPIEAGTAGAADEVPAEMIENTKKEDN